jgi:hemolysin activation/secretion protein
MLHGIRALNANQLSAGVAHASMPLGTDGLTLSLTTTYSDGHPGSAALSALHFASNGWTSTLQLNYPLLRGREESLWVWGGVSGKWLKSALAATPNSRDHLYELLAGATWNERDSDGLTSADATLTQGLDAFGATTSSPLRSRAAGSGAFTSLAATITRLQSLSQTSIGEFDLYGLLSGQAASRGLLASEQCGFGGATFGRAFDANEIVGDHCLMGSVELRLTPDVDKSFAGGVLDSAQFFLLADGGKVWNTGTLGFGDKRTEDGASLGVGLRLRLLDHVNGSVEYDQPVGHRVALENNRSGRVFVQLSVAN